MKKVLSVLAIAFASSLVFAFIIIICTWNTLPGGYVKNRLGLATDKLVYAKERYEEMVKNKGGQAPKSVAIRIE